MKKLLFLLVFIPLVSFGQEDIERYKVYETTNIYTSLLLDTATGKIWQLQIGIGDTDQLKTVLSDYKYAESVEEVTEYHNERMTKWEEDYNSKADSIVSPEDKKYWKPLGLDERLSYSNIAKNGRFKLYPTENIKNFIMVDVIDGRTWQVQWHHDEDKRLVLRFY